MPILRGRSCFPGQPPCDGESALCPEDRDSRVLPDLICQVRGKEGQGGWGGRILQVGKFGIADAEYVVIFILVFFWVNDFCSIIFCPFLDSHVTNLIKPWLLSPENMSIHIKFYMESQGFPEPIA